MTHKFEFKRIYCPKPGDGYYHVTRVEKPAWPAKVKEVAIRAGVVVALGAGALATARVIFGAQTGEIKFPPPLKRFKR